MMTESQNRWQQGSMPWQRTPNVLVTKSQLGRTKPSTRQLPEDGHYYGKEIPQDYYKAKQVIYDWQTHDPSDPNDAPTKNIIECNKSCAKKGMHTSSDFYQYRKSAPEIVPKPILGSREVSLKLPPKGFAYGKHNKPQDAIGAVLGGAYGLYQSQRLWDIYNTRTFMRDSRPRKLSAHMTKSYYLKKNSTGNKLDKLAWSRQPQKFFKMSKFDNATHKVDDCRRRPQTASVVSSNPNNDDQQVRRFVEDKR